MIVGISGLIGSGKTTAAMYLVNKHGFWRRRFADPLKDMMRTLGLTYEQIDGKEKELPCDMLGGNTPRRAMQTLGTEWGRSLDPDIWVKAWQKQVYGLSNPHIVADDVRFANEAKAVTEMGGVLIRIERDGIVQGTHPSETQTFYSDFIIKNNGTQADLFERIEAVFE